MSKSKHKRLLLASFAGHLVLTGCSNSDSAPGSALNSVAAEPSPPAAVADTTSDDGFQQPDVITVENYQQILKEAVRYTNTDNFSQFVQPLMLDEPSTEVLTEVVFPEEFGNNTIRRESFGCPSGGEKNTYRYANGNPWAVAITEFNDCIGTDGTRYDGLGIRDTSDDSLFRTHQFDMTRQNLSENSSASLQYQFQSATLNRLGNFSRPNYLDLEYREQYDEQTSIVSSYRNSQNWYRGSASISGDSNVTTFGYGFNTSDAFIAQHVSNTGSVNANFVLQSPATSNQQVTVDVGIRGSAFAVVFGGRETTLEEFLATSDFDTSRSPLPYESSEEPWQWNSGAINITAEDGSRIELNNFQLYGFDANLYDSQDTLHSIIPLQWADGFTISCRFGFCDRVSSD